MQPSVEVSRPSLHNGRSAARATVEFAPAGVAQKSDLFVGAFWSQDNSAAGKIQIFVMKHKLRVRPLKSFEFTQVF